MNIKRVFAGGMAALAAGATIFAAGAMATSDNLGDYVVTSDGSLSSPMVVIGNPSALGSGYPMDVVGAADIAAAVAGYATTPVAAGGGTGGSITGGVMIDTAGTKFYYGDTLGKSGTKTTLTKTDLSTMLASGTVTDDVGTTYNYDEYITIGANAYPSYSTSGGDLNDPVLHLNLSSTTTSAVLNFTVTLNKPMNISHSDVDGNAITLFGTSYTISPDSDYNTTKKLVLFGSSNQQILNAGESKEITVEGTTYTVELVGTSSATVAVIKVGTDQAQVTKGTTKKVGGLDVYVDDVFHISTTDLAANSAKLSFGSAKLTFEDGSNVKRGSSDDTVEGTLVFLSGTQRDGTITKLVVSVTASSSSADHILTGESFTDPVFGAKLAFGGVSSGDSETITVDNSGSTGADIKFTDYRGNEKSVIFSYTGTGSFAPDTNASSTNAHVVDENATIKRNDYIWMADSQQSDFGHVMRITSSGSLGTTSATIDLQDVWSGSTTKISLSDAGYGSTNFFIDGQEYFIRNVTSADHTYQITGGTGAGLGSVGNKAIVWPLVRTSQGGWVTVAKFNTTVATGAGNTTIELPTGDLVLNNSYVYQAQLYAAGVLSNNTIGDGKVVGQNVSVTVGRVTYVVQYYNVSNLTTVSLATAASAQTAVNRPAYLFIEENAKDTSSPEADIKDAVYSWVEDGSGSGVDTTIQQPVVTAAVNSGYVSWTSDNSVSTNIDRRGTIVKHDTDGQGLNEIAYNDEQSIALIGVGSNPVVTAGGSGGTVDQAIKITSSIAKLASEVNTASLRGDLILVGGPCANSLVATLAETEAAIPTCTDWDLETGLIKEVADAFGSGHKALVVAGTTGTNTRWLAGQVMTGVLDYSV
ncbi:MAG: S-layer protein [Nanoarchaeota archaeon]|nr:S-layer protein [Nanoarchaeota archaeon]